MDGSAAAAHLTDATVVIGVPAVELNTLLDEAVDRYAAVLADLEANPAAPVDR